MRFASILLLALAGLGLTTPTPAPARSLAVVACGVPDISIKYLCYSWGASATPGVSYVLRTRILNKIDWPGLTSSSEGAFLQDGTGNLSGSHSLVTPALGDSLIVRAQVWAVLAGVPSADTASASFVVKRVMPVPAGPSGLVVDSLP
jgi:hypothetical protein